MIDVHHHLLPPTYVRAMGESAIGSPSPGGKIPNWSLAADLELMQACGIDVAVTSVSAPGVLLADERRTIALARDCNAFGAECVRSAPQHLGLFASLPLPHVPAALAEIDYALDTLGAAGITLMTNYGGRYLGDPVFVPVLERLDAASAVVFVHPTACAAPSFDPDVVASTLEFPFDTARTIASLVLQRRISQFPRIRFIFCHGGGAITAVARRLAAHAARTPAIAARGELDVMAALRTLYYDTAGYFDTGALAAVTAIAPFDHVLFGTDYPFMNAPATAVAALDRMELDPVRREAIAHTNAAALLPQFARAATA